MIWLVALALAGGACLAVQAGINGELGRGLRSPVLAALISFSVGTLSLLGFALLSRARFPDPSTLAAIPRIAWVGGGMLGAFYLITTILGPARLGVAAFLAWWCWGNCVPRYSSTTSGCWAFRPIRRTSRGFWGYCC